MPDNFLPLAYQAVKEAGGLTIADEVQVGFGRVGDGMWAFTAQDALPDIVTMGKPMGNGHPLAAVVCRPELLKGFQDNYMYFNTFGGNPVSCAVGMAVLEVLEQENLLENVRQVGQYIADGLRTLQKKYDLIGDVRHRGLYFGVELVLDHQSKKPATAQSKQIVQMMKQRGILMSKIGRASNILKMRPPLPFSSAHADQLLATLDEVLAAL